MPTTSSGADVEFCLSWVLAPLSAQTFLAEIWGATPYHVPRACPGYFDRLLPGPSAVQKLLDAYRPEPSAVRLVRGDARHGPDDYRLADGCLDLVAVRNDFADGYTIVLDGVERYMRSVALLTHSIEGELNFATTVNAYITPPESQGLVAHYDEHDVLILQLQGSKVWHVYDGADVPPHVMRRQEPVAAAGLPPPADVRLQVGDTLYLPRGLVHAAEASSEPSVHLTVGIHAPTLLTLATGALRSLSLRDDRVHAQLPPRHLDDADARARVRVMLRAIAGALEEPSVVAGGLGELADVLVRRGRCPPVGRAVPNGLDGDTPVVKYQPLYSTVAVVAGGVALHFAQLVVNAGPDHEAALRFLSRNTEPFRVRDLPGLTAAQQKELARTLIVSGFLVPLPGD